MELLHRRGCQPCDLKSDHGPNPDLDAPQIWADVNIFAQISGQPEPPRDRISAEIFPERKTGHGIFATFATNFSQKGSTAQNSEKNVIRQQILYLSGFTGGKPLLKSGSPRTPHNEHFLSLRFPKSVWGKRDSEFRIPKSFDFQFTQPIVSPVSKSRYDNTRFPVLPSAGVALLSASTAPRRIFPFHKNQ